MTNEQARELGRRWLAAGGPWLDGMLLSADVSGTVYRLNGSKGVGGTLVSKRGAVLPWRRKPLLAPDFRDGATKGAALEWLRGHLGRSVYPAPDAFGAGWWWLRNDGDSFFTGAPTEAELYPLAAEALKGAP